MKYPSKSLTAKAKHDLLDASGFYKASASGSMPSSSSTLPLSSLSTLSLSPPAVSISGAQLVSSLYTYNDVQESKTINPKVRLVVV